MMKETIWNMFEKTGNLQAYLFYKEIEKKDQLKSERLPTEKELQLAMSN